MVIDHNGPKYFDIHFHVNLHLTCSIWYYVWV